MSNHITLVSYNDKSRRSNADNFLFYKLSYFFISCNDNTACNRMHYVLAVSSHEKLAYARYLKLAIPCQALISSTGGFFVVEE